MKHCWYCDDPITGKNDGDSCKICDAPCCTDCLAGEPTTCVECGWPVCDEHAVFCDNCDNRYCPACASTHVVECECGITLCDQCGHDCPATWSYARAKAEHEASLY